MANRSRVLIIGAGASGLTAAIHSARNGAEVTVLDHMPSPGKKLLLTGNGKCNLSNLDLSPDYYNGAEASFIREAFQCFDAFKTREFFLSLGVPLRNKDGCLYPYSEEAPAVLQALLSECERLDVKFNYNIGIRKVIPENDGFLLDTKEGEFCSDRLILATGGAYRKETGSDGSGLLYLKDLMEHPVVPLHPALLPLVSDRPYLDEVQGVRTKGTITIILENGETYCDTGELQLASYGLSGIPVFQVSRHAVSALLRKETVSCELDLLPGISENDAVSFYGSLFRGHTAPASALLHGTIHKKLIPVLLREAGVKDKSGSGITGEEIIRFVQTTKHLSLPITGHAKPEMAQCTAGGVDTGFVDPKTMGSKLVPGLFFCGEVLDVDGVCGGYNLQWAWTSGAIAGRNAALSAQAAAE